MLLVGRNHHATGGHFITNLFGRQMLFACGNAMHFRSDDSQTSELELRDRFEARRSLPGRGVFKIVFEAREACPVVRHKVPGSLFRRRRHVGCVGRRICQSAGTACSDSGSPGKTSRRCSGMSAAGVRRFDRRHKLGSALGVIQTHGSSWRGPSGLSKLKWFSRHGGLIQFLAIFASVRNRKS